MYRVSTFPSRAIVLEISMYYFLTVRPRLLNILHYLHLAEAHSQTTSDERDLLADCGRGRRLAVEIGTMMGVTAALISRQLAENGTLYCVDPYRGKSKLDPCERIAHRQIRRYGCYRKVVWVREYSQAAAGLIPDNLDFIFIDGDHSYEGLRDDWELYAPKIVCGGCVVLHDVLVPEWDPGRAALGSTQLYKSHLRYIFGWRVIGQVDSMVAMERI